MNNREGVLTRKYTNLEKYHGSKSFLLKYRIVKFSVNVLYPLACRISHSSKKVQKQSNVIVSLTSFPARIKKVYLTINSIMNQSVRPEKIILYLSKEQFCDSNSLPKTLKKLAENDLFNIEFVEGDIRSHKKYYYAIRDYSDHPVVTIDDDIIYPENLIEVLLNLHDDFPNAVCCTHAHGITKEKDNLLPYDKWDKETQTMNVPSIEVVPIGCGGVLYPPHCFNETDILNRGLFAELCPLADDLWLKVQCLRNGVLSVKSNKYPYWTFSQIIIPKNISLKSLNVGGGENDKQLLRLLERYPDIKKMLIEAVG